MKNLNLVLLAVIVVLLVYVAYQNNREGFEWDKRDYSDCSGDKLDKDYVDYMLDQESLVSHVPEMPYEATCKVLSRPGNH